MTEAGLASIENPSAYFVTKRERGDSVSGSAIAVLKEGSRPVIAEIESLVSPSLAHQRNHEKGYHEYADFHSGAEGRH